VTYPDHFQVNNSTIGPQPWMQLRNVATGETPSVSKFYDPSDGTNKNDLVQTLQVEWTNTSPVAQSVYGLLTKSGSRVTLQCRSRGYISTGHAVDVGIGTPTLSMIEVSRFGIGSDLGNGGILNIGGAFGISELRQNSLTMPLMPHVASWFTVGAGETITARVEVAFVSENWEGSMIDGGDGDTEATIVTGELRMDLFAVPSVVAPQGRAIPTIVGGAANVKYDREVDLGFADVETEVVLPSGLVEGDMLLAIVCNNAGLFGDVGPVEAGWTLLHDRNAAIFGGSLDVHMRIYLRTVGASEPATYSFTNSLLSEQTSILIGIRNATPYQASYGLDWFAASNVSSYRLVEEQKSPSISRAGQLLLGVSFFAHTPIQSPIRQAPPAGMTELVDLPGSGSTVEVAYLASPPNPTLERHFQPTQIPLFTGHSITASILIPGAVVYS